MSKVSGHGGWWVREGLPNAVVHNAEYDVETGADVRETRSVGCGGWTEGLPRFRRIESATFKVAEGDVAYPQALGFTEGAEVSFWLKRGALAQFDKITRAIVASVRVMNDQKKGRWVEIVCKHGRYQRSVPAPETGTTPQQQQSQNPHP